MHPLPPTLSCSAPIAPMSRAESELFMRVLLLKNLDPVFEGAEQFAAKVGAEAPFALRVLGSRLLAADPKPLIGEGAVMFCASLCKTPADCVMWAWTLVNRWHALSAERGPDFVYRVSDLAEDFPWGFPTREQYTSVWDAQKGDGSLGNLLDSASTWRLAARAA